jgi:hypothetical protein
MLSLAQIMQPKKNHFGLHVATQTLEQMQIIIIVSHFTVEMRCFVLSF